MGIEVDSNRITGLSQTEHRLEVRWSDGHVSTFPSIWLLEACSCDICGSTETAVRHGRLTDKPARPVVVSADVEDGRVVINWGEGHVSLFDPGWLRAHCLSDGERKGRNPKPLIWSADILQKLPYMDYASVAEDAEQHLGFLESIRDTGFVILRDVPIARERTEEVAGLVGKLRMTNYGIFELEAKPNPEIVGDMALPLALHTDEPYRTEPPAITFFHVLKQSDAGGESTLADGFNLARTLAADHPQAFETLCTVPARFNRTLQEGRAFEIQAPIFSRNRDGEVTGIRLLDRAMAPVDVRLEEVEPFYDALRILLSLIYEGAGRISVKLKAGEMLVFNNQRLLHGRTGFDPSTSRRHVRTCHADLDEFHSRLRVVYRKRGSADAWMKLGAGTRV